MRSLACLALVAAVGLAPRAFAQDAHRFLSPRFAATATGTLLVLADTITIDSKSNPDEAIENLHAHL
jgi:hypothetical protein